ncbi:hypothetical protein HMPREF9296_1803 [Prevotella disiens FB035-09AN]|uniref:Uncharacterized protein n=1 Tax=Prevotella disiens FB035-09AN TaxID=866771 RepID=E1KTJ3_9BACT|nr:hypothetical protein HMPREF9296_1803 [Prevotella disiens FB035-09AN]
MSRVDLSPKSDLINFVKFIIMYVCGGHFTLYFHLY